MSTMIIVSRFHDNDHSDSAATAAVKHCDRDPDGGGEASLDGVSVIIWEIMAFYACHALMRYL